MSVFTKIQVQACVYEHTEANAVNSGWFSRLDSWETVSGSVLQVQLLTLRLADGQQSR